jgi:hypothetical protein
MRRADQLLGALAVGAFVVGVVVAILGWAPRGHPPSVADWVIQAAVLITVIIIVADPVRREG